MIYPGKDYSTFRRADGLPDMDISFLEIEGGRVVLEAVARRLITAPGMMDDLDYGVDLRTYLNAALLQRDVGILQAAIRAEALKVDGVDDVQVAVDVDGFGGFAAEVSVELANEEEYTFAFVLSADTAPRVILPPL